MSSSASGLQFYLASSSPRRRHLLQQIGYQFAVLSIGVNEKQRPQESPDDYVKRMALEKARAGWSSPERHDLIPVLGSDTIIEVDGRILGKPEGRTQAIAMLQLLSGRCHHVTTAIAIKLEGKEHIRANTSQVCFRKLSLTEIRAYWETGEPADKAGAYAIQGMAAVFIERLEGSYSSVMGLPLFETAELLSEFGVKTIISDP